MVRGGLRAWGRERSHSEPLGLESQEGITDNAGFGSGLEGVEKWQEVDVRTAWPVENRVRVGGQQSMEHSLRTGMVWFGRQFGKGHLCTSGKTVPSQRRGGEISVGFRQACVHFLRRGSLLMSS